MRSGSRTVATLLILTACAKEHDLERRRRRRRRQLAGSCRPREGLDDVQSPAWDPCLVDSDGLTLYYDNAESGGSIACTGSCAAIWPPLLLPSGVSAATAGSGVDASKFGTSDRPDGGTQVTYAGMPLYLFTGDTAGQATGQGFEGFFAVTASGARTAGASGSAGSGGSRYCRVGFSFCPRQAYADGLRCPPDRSHAGDALVLPEERGSHAPCDEGAPPVSAHDHADEDPRRDGRGGDVRTAAGRVGGPARVLRHGTGSPVRRGSDECDAARRADCRARSGQPSDRTARSTWSKRSSARSRASIPRRAMPLCSPAVSRCRPSPSVERSTSRSSTTRCTCW